MKDLHVIGSAAHTLGSVTQNRVVRLQSTHQLKDIHLTKSTNQRYYFLRGQLAVSADHDLVRFGGGSSRESDD